MAMGLPWRIASNSSHNEMAAKFGRAGWLDLVAGRDAQRGRCDRARWRRQAGA